MSADKLVSVDNWEAPDKTGYNDFPVGWERITRAEFAKSHFFTYGAEYIEHRQMYGMINKSKRDMSKMTSAILFWMHDNTGYAIEHFYMRKKKRWGLRFYRFGCKHKWGGEPTERELATVPHGRCIHWQKCKKCGYFTWYDSSD